MNRVDRIKRLEVKTPPNPPEYRFLVRRPNRHDDEVIAIEVSGSNILREAGETLEQLTARTPGQVMKARYSE